MRDPGSVPRVGDDVIFFGIFFFSHHLVNNWISDYEVQSASTSPA